ncbi:MAG TPA: ATP-dependent protease ATPase subunit HslU [Candidatus Ornithoclostridium faecigallinarum]|nr:ATP-dependent protease ATPase subunit HslU [Candidatus Ornithoclostridium faecigallinarum]
MEQFTPKQIVKELDRYIIGQDAAKKAVAIALRNRYRRSQLPQALRDEITPKNIIMQGPTGVGKTEIARRLAKIVNAPFVKVEATKFTEVGYVGRDVESMVRDLVEVSVRMVRDERSRAVEATARPAVLAQLTKVVAPHRKSAYPDLGEKELFDAVAKEIASGSLDDLKVEISLPEKTKSQQLPGGMEINIMDMMGGLLPKRNKVKKVTVAQAYRALMEQECEKLIDPDALNAEAIRRAENEGIIFIDEMDKIAAKGNTSGPDVSREGVQRDILPIVEGCTVNTKYGPIKTDYILFIAAGAFHIAAVSDLIPELQGRFPIGVKLDSLTAKDFIRILTEPDNAILMQYTELLKVDNVSLKFTDAAIAKLAAVAEAENENSENIGARRLHTIMETLLDDISFNAGNVDQMVEVVVDEEYVLSHLDKTIRTLNLHKYIL